MNRMTSNGLPWPTYIIFFFSFLRELKTLHCSLAKCEELVAAGVVKHKLVDDLMQLIIYPPNIRGRSKHDHV
jgi:hypothetical protein